MCIFKKNSLPKIEPQKECEHKWGKWTMATKPETYSSGGYYPSTCIRMGMKKRCLKCGMIELKIVRD